MPIHEGWGKKKTKQRNLKKEVRLTNKEARGSPVRYPSESNHLIKSIKETEVKLERKKKRREEKEGKHITNFLLLAILFKDFIVVVFAVGRSGYIIMEYTELYDH